MKTVFTVLGVLALVHSIVCECPTADSSAVVFTPECTIKELRVRWPNYQDPTTFYVCKSDGTSVLNKCPSGQVFTYVFQQCGPCSDYIPPVPCDKLKTENPPQCEPSSSSTGSTADPSTTTAEPSTTTAKPTTTTAKPTTPKPTTTTAKPTTTPVKPTTPVPTPPGPTPPGPTPPGPTPAVPYPTPPSPLPTADVPMPSTPPPTPPSVAITPPVYTQPPVSG